MVDRIDGRYYRISFEIQTSSLWWHNHFTTLVTEIKYLTLDDQKNIIFSFCAIKSRVNYGLSMWLDLLDSMFLTDITSNQSQEMIVLKSGHVIKTSKFEWRKNKLMNKRPCVSLNHPPLMHHPLTIKPSTIDVPSTFIIFQLIWIVHWSSCDKMLEISPS